MAVQQSVAVRAFDHTAVPVMDLWRAERFYTEVLDGAIFQKVGMTYRPPAPAGEEGGRTFVDPPGAFVRLGRNHLGLFLQNQTAVQPPVSVEQALPCLGLAINEAAFATGVERVRAAGMAVGPERTQSFGPLQWRSVRCTDSEGNCLELRAVGDSPSEDRMVLGISHLQGEARDLAETTAFYVDMLGLAVAAEGPSWVALALASSQHLVFHEVDELSPATVGPYFGRHFAFSVDDETFHGIVARLHAAGIEEGDALGRHVPDEFATYFYDPNGLWLQITNHDSAHARSGRVMMRYAAV
jgi:catechol 2,3-dioxygenase-like lactoylglutathione lyase family enzyme